MYARRSGTAPPGWEVSCARGPEDKKKPCFFRSLGHLGSSSLNFFGGGFFFTIRYDNAKDQQNRREIVNWTKEVVIMQIEKINKLGSRRHSATAKVERGGSK